MYFIPVAIDTHTRVYICNKTDLSELKQFYNVLCITSFYFVVDLFLASTMHPTNIYTGCPISFHTDSFFDRV